MKPVCGSPTVAGLPLQHSVLLLGGHASCGLRPLARSAFGVAGTSCRVLLMTGRIFRSAGSGRLGGFMHLLAGGVVLCALGSRSGGLRDGGRGDQQGCHDDEWLVHERISSCWTMTTSPLGGRSFGGKRRTLRNKAPRLRFFRHE